MRELFAKLFRRQAPTENDLDSEILAHIELGVDDNIAAGMTPAEARDEARRHFGNVLLTRERAREAWRFPRIDSSVRTSATACAASAVRRDSPSR